MFEQTQKSNRTKLFFTSLNRQPQKNAQRCQGQRLTGGIIHFQVPAFQFGSYPPRQISVPGNQCRRFFRRFNRLSQQQSNGQSFLPHIGTVNQRYTVCRLMPDFLPCNIPPFFGSGRRTHNLAD